jgi:tetratricopeptide (TPR) repeat protein
MTLTSVFSKLILIIALALQTVMVVAQRSIDTVYANIVSFDELRFSSADERELFANGMGGLTVQQRFKALVRTQDTLANEQPPAWRSMLTTLKGLKRAKTNVKYIHDIYQTVHSSVLRKYALNTSFDRIFSAGDYNCVTASALYALVFEELGIPYQLKELPHHVYIVAFPNEGIVVESTDPRSGLFDIGDEFKTTFVDDLVKAKIISAEERRREPLADLFNKHYFNDKAIGFKELVALQYLNQGFYLMEDELYREALPNLEKAAYLYPTKQVVAGLSLCMAHILDKSSYADDGDVDLLARLTRLDPVLGYGEKEVGDEFRRITYDLLIEKGDRERYDRVFAVLMKQVKSDSLRNNLDYVHSYETARSYMLGGLEEAGLPHAYRALKLKPANLESQHMVISAYYKKLEANGDPIPDPDLSQAFLAIKDSVPLIWSNNNYRNLYVQLHVLKGTDMVRKSRYQDALAFLSEIKALYAETGIKPKAANISYICGELAKHYFKRSDYKKAKEAVGFGLELYPSDDYLTSIRSQLN